MSFRRGGLSGCCGGGCPNTVQSVGPECPSADRRPVWLCSQFAPDTGSQLAKHLQRTLCTELTNELFQHAAADNGVQYDENKELSAEVSDRTAREMGQVGRASRGQLGRLGTAEASVMVGRVSLGQCRLMNWWSRCKVSPEGPLRACVALHRDRPLSWLSLFLPCLLSLSHPPVSLPPSQYGRHASGFMPRLCVQARVKILNKLPQDMAPDLLKLHKALAAAELAEFDGALEPALATCGIMLKKQDRKKDR